MCFIVVFLFVVISLHKLNSLAFDLILFIYRKQSCKRHIMASNGVEEESRKRRKAGSISTYTSAVPMPTDKENNHPNIKKSGVSNGKNVTFDERSTYRTEANVMTLKVVELRKLLSDKGLDTTGLKKVLQNRLIEAIHDERNSCHKNFDEKSMEVIDAKDDTGDTVEDEIMSNVNDINEANRSNEEDTDESNQDQFKDDIQMIESLESKAKKQSHSEVIPSVEEDVEMVDEQSRSEKDSKSAQNEVAIGAAYAKNASQKKTFGSKILSPIKKVFSPNKAKKSPLKSKPGSSTKDITILDEAVQSTCSNNNGSCDEEIRSHKFQSKSKRSSMVYKMTVDEIKSAKTKESVAELPDNKRPSSQKASNNSVTSSSQKLRTMKEARKARLDEIRNKVRSSYFSYTNVCLLHLTSLILLHRFSQRHSLS